MDPVVTPLLALVLGDVAKRVLEDACTDHLKDKVKALFGRAEATGHADNVELAYDTAMKGAYAACLESLLLALKSAGQSEEELKEYRASLIAFVKDQRVGLELLAAMREPHRADLPSPEVLGERWSAGGGRHLPGLWVWNAVASGFRGHAKKQLILSDELRELANAQTQAHIAELSARREGLPIVTSRDRYARRMRTKFAPVDLANLMPAAADDPGALIIRDVFVPQFVRENPPPVELPKDVAQRIALASRHDVDGMLSNGIDKEQAEILRASFARQPARPALEVITSPSARLLVLTGEPGSGKSTLMRYLLTTLLELTDARSLSLGAAWTSGFRGAFPLLIELRDFHALREQGECDTFLDYVAYMGRTDHWSIDDHTANAFLENGPSLVMFDGLDEILDPASYRRTVQEIAAFSQRYSSTRIIVTTRPVGYRDQALRSADFAHYGIQDLNEKQITTFVRGWFSLTFPHDREKAEQRIVRVLASVGRSRPIRLLAGNPMLLTIMALLAREAELPRERARFYEKAVEVLCHHWDVNRNVGLPDDRYLTADDKKALLQRVAMRMQVGDGGLRGNVIHENDLEVEIECFLKDERWHTDPAEARKAARRMIRQLRERNYILCLRGPSLYGFVHRTFLEYLTAADYVRRFDKQPQELTLDGLLELFDRHGTDDDWREVLRLVCAQLDARIVSRIIDRLAEGTNNETRHPLRVSAISLAIASVGEVRNAAKLDEASCGRLLRIAVDEFRRVDAYEFEPLLDTAEELSRPWPYASAIKSIVTGGIQTPDSYGGEFLVRFVLTLNQDRDIAEAFSKSDVPAHRAVAFEALASKWPDEQTRTFLEGSAIHDAAEDARSASLISLASTWADERTRTLLEARLLEDSSAEARGAALDALARNWPDDFTRRMVEAHAETDEAEYTRSIAINDLATYWPDVRTRTLLEKRAVEDQLDEPRGVAVMALARNWPDESTRTLVEACASQDDGEYTRSVALNVLASNWRDDRNRTLLEARAVEDEMASVRQTALRSLATTWTDERTRNVLEARAVGDESESTRGVALSVLTSYWRDERARALLQVRAEEDVAAQPRGIALNALANNRQDDRTRDFLRVRAEADEAAQPRGIALRALAENWQDEETRTLLESRAIEDKAGYTRGIALNLLTRYWLDERTRTFLELCGFEDPASEPRGIALVAIASNWPDQRIENHLHLEAAANGYVASYLAARHSAFGALLFTRDLDGLEPYIDPTKPISREHAVKAGTRAGVAHADVDRLMGELSAHLGWDVWKGSQAGL